MAAIARGLAHDTRKIEPLRQFAVGGHPRQGGGDPALELVEDVHSGLAGSKTEAVIRLALGTGFEEARR